MFSVPYERFRSEVEEIYSLRAKGTACKMRQVLREIGETGVKTTDELRPVIVARWLKAHPERAPATADSLLRSFRAAVTIGAASGYLSASPLAVRFALPDGSTEEAPKVRHYSVDQVERMLRLAREEAAWSGTWQAYRLEALLSTYAFAALRRNEALYLQWEDVDWSGRVLRVHPIRAIRRKLKTPKSAAPVPMAPALEAALRRWQSRAGYSASWVFPTVNRKSPWTGGPTGQKPLCRIKALGARAGVSAVTILGFRHSFSTHAARWGISREMVRAILRHTTIKTAESYIHADLPDLIDAAGRIGYATPQAPAA